MLDWTEYAKICLALLVIVNPVGAVPLFASMTAGNSEREKKQIARVASTSVGLVLIIAAVAGQSLLGLFGISMASFKVGGAILILLMAIAMMHATPSRESQTPEEAREARQKENIAVVPLAMDPARQAHRGTGVGSAQSAAVVGAIGVHGGHESLEYALICKAR